MLDLQFVVTNMAGAAATGLGGASSTLKTTETPTDVRIELAADVLFDFDKANIRPEGVEAVVSVTIDDPVITQFSVSVLRQVFQRNKMILAYATVGNYKPVCGWSRP